MSDFIWVEKYRPKKIEDCILPDSIKKTFRDFLTAGEIPNLLLSGPPGIGKTTVAKALCKELGVESCDGTGWFRGPKMTDTLHRYFRIQAGEEKLPDQMQLCLR